MSEHEASHDPRGEKDEIANSKAAVFKMRIRVAEIVSGICTLLLGTVALIEEKTMLNLGLGIPTALIIILASANGIYTSRGFDGYQPPRIMHKVWGKFRFLGPTIKAAVTNIFLWLIAFSLAIILILKALKQIIMGSEFTLITVASIEILLLVSWMIMIIVVAWIDIHYDPDWQEPSDLAYSTTATAVSMVTLS